MTVTEAATSISQILRRASRLVEKDALRSQTNGDRAKNAMRLSLSPCKNVESAPFADKHFHVIHRVSSCCSWMTVICAVQRMLRHCFKVQSTKIQFSGLHL